MQWNHFVWVESLWMTMTCHVSEYFSIVLYRTCLSVVGVKRRAARVVRMIRFGLAGGGSCKIELYHSLQQ